MSSPKLRRLALLSVTAAVLTIGLKAAAYAVTGSAGLLSDALESVVNLLAATTAYFSLWYAARPADRNHTFGHEKVEFFASGLEGAFILLAGAGTIWYAVERLVRPQQLEALGVGAAIGGAAAVVNLAVARVLLKAGREHRNVVLEADGHHLLADVYTSAGVIAGLGLVSLTGLVWLDSVLAVLVGLNILVTAVRLVSRSVNGLMDHALPAEDQAKLRADIRAALPAGTAFHALRTRQAGSRPFAEFHLLVPGGMTVREAHDLTHRLTDQLRQSWPTLVVTTHLEPVEDRQSWEAAELAQLGEPAGPEG